MIVPVKMPAMLPDVLMCVVARYHNYLQRAFLIMKELLPLQHHLSAEQLDTARRAKSVSQLHAGFPISQPAMSQHLAALRSAGLVSERRQEGSLCIQVDLGLPLELRKEVVLSLQGLARERSPYGCRRFLPGRPNLRCLEFSVARLLG